MAGTRAATRIALRTNERLEQPSLAASLAFVELGSSCELVPAASSRESLARTPGSISRSDLGNFLAFLGVLPPGFSFVGLCFSEEPIALLCACITVTGIGLKLYHCDDVLR